MLVPLTEFLANATLKPNSIHSRTVELADRTIDISRHKNKQLRKQLMVMTTPECRCCKSPANYVHVSDTDNSCHIICDNGHYLTLDHIKPLILDGVDHPSNWQVLCKRCNMSKGGSHVEHILMLRLMVLVTYSLHKVGILHYYRRMIRELSLSPTVAIIQQVPLK